jgi:hypothetical protein
MLHVEVVDIVEDGLDLIGRGGSGVLVGWARRRRLSHCNFRHDCVRGCEEYQIGLNIEGCGSVAKEVDGVKSRLLQKKFQDRISPVVVCCSWQARRSGGVDGKRLSGFFSRQRRSEMRW